MKTLLMIMIGMVSQVFVWGGSNALLLEKLEKLEKRISEQESLRAEIESLREEVEALKADKEESYLDDAPVKSSTGGLTFGGYVDVEYIHRNQRGVSRPSQFDQHRFIFDVAADLGPKLKFVSELEFEHAGDEIAMEQAYLEYDFERSFGVRMGSILVPIGRMNEQHDSPLRELTERPRVNRLIVPTTWFDIGAGIFGEMASNSLPISYELYLMNGLQDGANADRTATFLDTGTGFRSLRQKGKGGSEETHNKALTGRMGLTLNDQTSLGLSFYQADVGAFTIAGQLQGERSLRMKAIDWEKQINQRLELIGEYIRGDVENNVVTGSAGYDFSGWYSQFNFILDRDEKYRAVFRWGATDTDESRSNGGDVKEKVLGLSYRPNSNAVFRIEYHWEDELNANGVWLDNNGFVLGAATYF